MSTHLLLGFTAGVYLTHGSVPQTLLFLDGFSAFFEFMFSYPYYYLAMYLTLGSMGSYHLMRALHSKLKDETTNKEEEQEAEQEEAEEQEAEEQATQATQAEQAEQEEQATQAEQAEQATQAEQEEQATQAEQEAEQETEQTAEDGDETEEEMQVETISEDMDIETDDDMPPLLPLSPHEEQDAYAPLFQVINA
jgi:HD superfamily phosphohydrolase